MLSRWFAVSSIREAWDETVGLLFKPFNIYVWIKLALITLLAGGLFGGVSGNLRIGDMEEIPVRQVFDHLYIVVAIVAFVMLLLIIFQLISAVYSLVFIEALVERKFGLVAGFRRNYDRAIPLFIFSLGLFFLVILALGAWFVGLLKGAALFAGMSLALKIIAFLSYLALLFILLLLVSLVAGFTNDFAIVLMIYEGGGLAQSLRNVGKIISENRGQTIVYVLASILLHIISAVIVVPVGFIVGVLEILFVLVLAVAIGFLAGIFMVTAGFSLTSIASNPMMLAPIVIAALATLTLISLVFTLVSLFITLPVTVYFRYYSILVLEKLGGRKIVKKIKKMPEKDLDKVNEPGRGKTDLKVY